MSFSFWPKINPSPRQPDPIYLKPEDVDNEFDKLSIDWWKISEIRENIKSLISKNNIIPKRLDDILHIKNLCDRKKYSKFLRRRNDFLQKHQVMDANEFAKLFWNDNLQNNNLRSKMMETLKETHSKYNDGKERDINRELISGKYNKSDINQGILWICVFDTFLKQLKETPFFETLIRCSLQRNEKNDWWKCLIPFCNNEWKYEEISDADIKYLKNIKYEGKELISNTALWFNIIETLLVKMACNKKEYPKLSSGRTYNKDDILSSYCYADFIKMKPEELAALLDGQHSDKIDHGEFLHDITYWIDNVYAYNYFLWPNTIKQGCSVDNFNDDEIEWLIKLTKTWIIKLTTWVTDRKINNYIKNNIPNYGNKQTINHSIDEDSNEKTLIERWYPLNVIYQAWPNEEVSIWNAKGLWTTFKIKWTKERFVPLHAYSIEWMHKKNGETFVTIINPRYTWKKIDVPLKYMKDFFYIWIYWFNLDNMFVEDKENQKDQK